MALRNYGGPGLGRGAGWECPYCGGPNASARGSQCVHCGKPEEETVTPTLETDRTPDGAEASPLDAPLGSNAEPKHTVSDGPREQLVRRYKLIEYYGDPAWVEQVMSRSLFGAQAVGTHGYLIGTEVSESAVSSQTELNQRMTDARTTEPTWLGGMNEPGRDMRPEPPTVFQQTMRAMEEVMEKDPRYARTMAVALNDWVEKNAETELDATVVLTPDEVSQVVHILTLISTEKEPQPA